MMGTRGWKVIQAHVPMIKFRKGGTNHVIGDAVSSAVPGAGTNRASGSGATGPSVVTLSTIEDFQLPLKFQRRPIDFKEIEYINRGGPE